MAAAASGADTRLSSTSTTSKMRSRPCAWATTRSPARTVVAGLAAAPFTLTWPPRHASVAIERVLYRRTAHSHRSTRVSSTPRLSQCPLELVPVLVEPRHGASDASDVPSLPPQTGEAEVARQAAPSDVERHPRLGVRHHLQ